ncbi:MAG: putative sugar phosphatases of the HAD superfamily [Haloquadratum sp. J07HQX50]|nr:MAG: putative sugar phosphatases of the HAD superfamily [Haloquadratum sp. J07HQX50]
MPIEAMIFDVDGTVVRGSTALPGANEAMDLCRRHSLDRLFVSNNPTEPAHTYKERFRSAGLTVDCGEILTAGEVTRQYLVETHPEATIGVVGESGLLSLLSDAGLHASSIYQETYLNDAPDVFVASIDREFEYQTLTRCLRVLGGADIPFIGTDPDMVIPAADGDIPGSGAIIHAIANVLGRQPTTILGKPSSVAQQMILDKLGHDPSDVILIGDRLDTDIALGNNAGMYTAQVQTGIAAHSTPESHAISPDYEIDSLADIPDIVSQLS